MREREGGWRMGGGYREGERERESTVRLIGLKPQCYSCKRERERESERVVCSGYRQQRLIGQVYRWGTREGDGWSWKNLIRGQVGNWSIPPSIYKTGRSVRGQHTAWSFWTWPEETQPAEVSLTDAEGNSQNSCWPGKPEPFVSYCWSIFNFWKVNICFRDF